MLLREVFDSLAYSEIAQLNIGDANSGLINEQNYDKVLNAISLGLTALHSRFNIKEETLYLKLDTGRYNYRISSKNTVSSGSSTPYILDTLSAPYKDTLLKIEKVYSVTDVEFPLNDESSLYSVHTPNLSTLDVYKGVVDSYTDVPEYYVGNTLRIVYRANHRILPAGFNGYDADKVEIDLPYTYMEPLLFYVGSRMHNPMGLTNDFNAGNNYYAKYERACQDIERHNVRVDQGNQNTKLVCNGWV